MRYNENMLTVHILRSGPKSWAVTINNLAGRGSPSPPQRQAYLARRRAVGCLTCGHPRRLALADCVNTSVFMRHLDVRSYEKAVAIVTKYFPLERFPRKALYALQELLA